MLSPWDVEGSRLRCLPGCREGVGGSCARPAGQGLAAPAITPSCPPSISRKGVAGSVVLACLANHAHAAPRCVGARAHGARRADTAGGVGLAPQHTQLVTHLPGEGTRGWNLERLLSEAGGQPEHA